MLLPWLTLFDLRGTAANFMPDKKLDHRYYSDDFAVLIPVYNNVSYISSPSFVNFIKKYPGKVALCTTNLETEEFYHDLEAFAKKYDFIVVKCDFTKDNKNPWKIYQKTLVAHDFVLGEALHILNAKYVIFLDADTTCRTDLHYLVGTMEHENYDLASVRVIPSKKQTVAEQLQYIEYTVAMKSRKIYPWLTSGAAMIGKRERLQDVMAKHSLFFNGGDVEIGKLANLTGLKVGHIPATFYTDVPPTLWKLFRQRFSWFCGAFRHSVINAHTNLFSPIYSLYFTLIIFFMLPFKYVELVKHWYVVPFLFIFYIIITLISNWNIRSPYMLLFPLYSFVQVLVMPVMGIGRYIKTVITTKNTGFIKVWYKKDYSIVKYAFNLALIAFLTYAVFNIHTVESWFGLQNIDLLAFLKLAPTVDSPWNLLYNGMKLVTLLVGVYALLAAGFSLAYNFKVRRFFVKTGTRTRNAYRTAILYTKVFISRLF